MSEIVLCADAFDTGRRLDVFIAQKADITRSAAVRLIEEGMVSSGGEVSRKNYRIRGDETFIVTLPEPKPVEIVAQDIALSVLYEDDDLIAVNKPRGMVVHPAAGHADGTLVNALLHHCGDSLSGVGGEKRPGIVHRLDKDTTGVIIAAKNDFTHNKITARLKARDVLRQYEAVVLGSLGADSGEISAPVGRHPGDRRKMAINEKNGREAITRFDVICAYPGYAHVLCSLVTGRTHQIRVHMSHKGHPVAGDAVYGGTRRQPLNTPPMLLHAVRVGFPHPRTGESLVIEAPLPPEFTGFLEKLRKR